MRAIYVYILRDKSSLKPTTVGIDVGGEISYFEIFRPGSRKIIKTIYSKLDSIKNFIIEATKRGYKVVTSRADKLVVDLKLPLDQGIEIYDNHIDIQGEVFATENFAKDRTVVRKILERMREKPIVEYQRLLGQTSLIYHQLQKVGLIINDEHFYPKWSLATHTGRSKSIGFNLQGLAEDAYVHTPFVSRKSVLIRFDWVSADIRMASVLSGDQALIDSFGESDPYQYMVNITELDRDQCKLFLLKCINSMRYGNDAIVQIFPKLDNWIYRCRQILDAEGCLETIMHRKYNVSKQRSELSVFNATMQGSVAHAMHGVVCKLWEEFGRYFVCDIHDSVTLSVPDDRAVIKSVIDKVTPMMLYPFSGHLLDNPVFPTRISIGRTWRSWKLLRIVRQ